MAVTLTGSCKKKKKKSTRGQLFAGKVQASTLCLSLPLDQCVTLHGSLCITWFIYESRKMQTVPWSKHTNTESPSSIISGKLKLRFFHVFNDISNIIWQDKNKYFMLVWSAAANLFSNSSSLQEGEKSPNTRLWSNRGHTTPYNILDVKHSDIKVMDLHWFGVKLC